MKDNLNCEGGKTMRLITYVLLSALLTVTVGCGGTNPLAVQCNTNEDCTSGCEGYDNAVCSTDGICFCGDAVPTARCNLDEDCADACTGSDSFSCSGGICNCLYELGCTEDADCSQMCGDCRSATCTEGVCTCSGCESEGTLAVIVVPYNGRYNISNADTGDMLFSDVPGGGYYQLPFGDYTVDFLSMHGYNTPPPTTITLDAERHPFVVVSGVYQLIEPTLTITDNGPSAFTVPPGTNDVDVLYVGLTGNGLFVVRNTRVVVRAYDAAGVLVSTADEGVYAFLKNLKIVDTDSGSTLMGPLTTVDQADRIEQGGYVWYSKVLTEDYELIAMETRHLAIRLDVDDFPSDYSFDVEFSLVPEGGGTSYVKDVDLNTFLEDNDIIGDPVMSRRVTVVGNSLTVTKADMPVSTTVVKGYDGVPSLGIQLTAGLTGDIMVKKIFVRVYADTQGGADFSTTGDIAANTVIAWLTLMDGADVVAGPEALTLVDLAVDGSYTPDADFYKSVFDSLNLVVEQGTTKTLTPHVRLLNTMSETVFYALDVVPVLDVVAEDSDANQVIPTGAPLNSQDDGKDPEITVLTQGTLQVGVERNPESGIVIAGDNNVLVNRYLFDAMYESFGTNKLTIVNDPDGVFGDDIVSTVAVAQVTVTYRDINGAEQSRSRPLFNGQTTFSNLGFYVPDDASQGDLDIYVDVSPEAVSGQTFRLGILEVGNDVSTFEAIGQASSEAIYDPAIFLSGNSGTFTVQ